MKVLLPGASGQVGTEIQRLARGRRIEIVPLTRAELDIGDRARVMTACAHARPELVINAAAHTAVDRAEDEPDAAYRANRDGPAHLAEWCADHDVPLFHLSTDYAFGGAGTAPKTPPAGYREDDATAPRGVYAESKVAGEQAVARILDPHVILRVSWVFGAHGKNFLTTILSLARERTELRVVGDQHGCPTAAADIAGALLTLAEKYAAERARGGAFPWGTYHFAGAPPTTWHGFAERIVAAARPLASIAAERVTRITTAEYPTRAPRPTNTILDCRRIRETFGIEAPPWEPAVARTVAELIARANV